MIAQLRSRGILKLISQQPDLLLNQGRHLQQETAILQETMTVQGIRLLPGMTTNHLIRQETMTAPAIRQGTMIVQAIHLLHGMIAVMTGLTMLLHKEAMTEVMTDQPIRLPKGATIQAGVMTVRVIHLHHGMNLRPVAGVHLPHRKAGIIPQEAILLQGAAHVLPAVVK